MDSLSTFKGCLPLSVSPLNYTSVRELHKDTPNWNNIIDSSTLKGDSSSGSIEVADKLSAIIYLQCLRFSVPEQHVSRCVDNRLSTDNIFSGASV